MGEYADYECERSFNEAQWDEEQGIPIFTGDTYRPPVPHRRKTFVCKYCKQGGFVWHEHEGGYRLFTITGELHSCKMTRA
jgi:hypothetical protein